jgi:hypothetical protein
VRAWHLVGLIWQMEDAAGISGARRPLRASSLRLAPASGGLTSGAAGQAS